MCNPTSLACSRENLPADWNHMKNTKNGESLFQGSVTWRHEDWKPVPAVVGKDIPDYP